jgi:hypothetical protein
MSPIRAPLQSLGVLLLALWITGMCCGGPAIAHEPDTDLMIEVLAEVDDGLYEQLCGAEVVARDGETEILLEEEVIVEDSESRCVYRAEVDPEIHYAIEVRHPDLGVVDGGHASSDFRGCGGQSPPGTVDHLVFIELEPEEGEDEENENEDDDGPEDASGGA